VGRTARRTALVLLAAILLAGCATTARPSASRPDQASQTPRRCSTTDPDRWAWFCVVGQILYGAASFFTPVNELTMR
jgi:outer membrane biogenesis lipoprotein LolB